ncbi:MAG: zinc ribbon domain-containing protein [Halobacteriota archaeon]
MADRRFCKLCGAEIPRESRFCGSCGAALSDTPPHESTRSLGFRSRGTISLLTRMMNARLLMSRIARCIHHQDKDCSAT